MEAFALVRWQSKVRTREHQSAGTVTRTTPVHIEKPRSRLIADQAHDLHGHDHDGAPLHRPQALYPPLIESPSQQRSGGRVKWALPPPPLIRPPTWNSQKGSSAEPEPELEPEPPERLVV